MSDRDIANKYFEDNPDAKDGMVKAFFAYETYHPRHFRGAHHYAGPTKDCVCEWCGRSRREVRWDDLPGPCQKRPELPEIADVIHEEEEKAWALIRKAETEVPRLIAKMGMSGETLAVLHHTHGYTREIVECITDVPPEAASKYLELIDFEKNRSRKAFKRQTVTAV